MGGFRGLVEEPHQGGIHPQMEAAAEKEGEAGLPRRAEAAFRGINYTKTAPEHCVVYARNWLAILGIQSEYVYYRKGNQKRKRR